jgi:hypothetical protein
MIKLTNILKEIQVNKPISKFKNNDELAHRLRTDSSFKRKLLDSVWDNPNWERSGRDWSNVKKRWYIADIEQYSNLNYIDEILISDDNDNRLYISVHPMLTKYKQYQYEFILDHNKFYWQYY